MPAPVSLLPPGVAAGAPSPARGGRTLPAATGERARAYRRRRRSPAWNLRAVLGALSFLLLQPVAAVVLELDDGGSAMVPVSLHDLTRIAMTDGGAIAKVWGRNTQVMVQPDTEAGEVFIRPLSGSRPFSLYVRDRAGATYTLLAVPKDVPADTVFIRAAAPARRPVTGAHAPGPYLEALQLWMRALARGTAPPGSSMQTLHAPVRWWPGVEVVLLQRADDRTWYGERYRLKNVSTQPLQLREPVLSRFVAGVRALALRRHVLAPGEHTELYLVRDHE